MERSQMKTGWRRPGLWNTLLIGFALVSLVRLLGASGSMAETQSSSTAGDEGRALYQKKCVICHGKDGVARPMGKGAPDLNDPAWQETASIKKIAKQILTGMGKMPKQEGKLTQEQSEAIAQYVLTLK